MIFVAVSNKDATYTVPVLDQIGDVWNNLVYSRHGLFGKEHAGIDDY